VTATGGIIVARSPAEIAVRVVAKLIEIGDDRVQAMAGLAPAVRAVIFELDPDGTRDTTACWWQHLPPWVRLDSFDRLRRGYDGLVVIEAQADTIRVDLAGMLTMAPVGTPARPLGLSHWDAYRRLDMMAAVSRTHLTDMTRESRMITPRLTPAPATALRVGLRALDTHHRQATIERARLAVLELAVGA
jgi:hypothetical protein